MKLNEVILTDIYNAASSDIRQGFGLPSTISRFDSLSEISHYDIQYEPYSFYKFGIFKFNVSGNRELVYANSNGDEKERRYKSRVNTTAEYEIRIMPKSKINNTTDLLNVDVELFCECNDFRYVFLDAAYKGYASLGTHIKKYGLIPITDRSRSLIRYTPEYKVGNKEKANVRNPHADGSVCKHVLLLIDRLESERDWGYDLDDMNNDIEKRNATPPQPIALRKRDLGKDNQFFDDNNMPKGIQKITQERNNIIRSILNINAIDIKTNTLSNFDFKSADNLEDIKDNLTQELWAFDSYYINKALAEIKNGSSIDKYYYLPNDWENGYKKITKHFEDIADDLSQFDDNEVKIKKDIQKGIPLDKNTIDDILSVKPSKKFDIDSNTIDDILKESYVMKYEQFKKMNKL